MPRTKTRVEARILCFPKSAIPKSRYAPVHIADMLSEMMNLGGGDGLGTLPDDAQSSDPSGSAAWNLGSFAGNDAFETFDKLDFVRFKKDGVLQESASVSEADDDSLAGAILEARDGFLDCKIGTTKLDNPAVFDQIWEPVAGKWTTVQPRESPARCFIYNSGSDLHAEAQTRKPLPRNRQVRLDLHFTMMKATGQTPTFRFIWGGGKFSFVFRHGSKPTIETWNSQISRWVVLRRLDKAPIISMAGKSYQVRIRRINGRLILSINEHSFYIVLNQKSGAVKAQEIEAVWESSPIQVACDSCHARVGVALIKYASKLASDKPETPHVGSYKRFKKATTPMPQSENGNAVTGYARGWAGAGTSVSLDGVVVAGNPPTGGLRYTAKLTANADGIDTPFISNALLSLPSTWSEPARPYLDITPYATRIGLTSGMPPMSSGAEATVTINRAHLDEIVGASTAKSYVDAFHLIEIQLRWRYDDGTADNWANLFRGYIMRPSKSSAPGNQQMMTLSCQDSVVRLKKPAALIDASFKPFDYLFNQQIAQGKSLYGYQCVQEILRTVLGPEGDSLHTSLIEGMYPLLSLQAGGYIFAQKLVDQFGNATFGGTQDHKWLLPPDFGSDAIGSIQKFCEMDRAVFFYGSPTSQGTGAFPIACYGQIQGFIAGREVKQIHNILNGDDEANRRLLLSSDVEFRPDKAINEIQVWGKPATGTMMGFIPSREMGLARLPSSDANSAERSWRRSLLLKPTWANIPSIDGFSVAQYMASRGLRDFEGVTMDFPKFVTRFASDLTWGDIVSPQLDSTDCGVDKSLGISGKKYRVEKTDHVINLVSKDGGASHATTTLHVWPVSASGNY